MSKIGATTAAALHVPLSRSDGSRSGTPRPEDEEAHHSKAEEAQSEKGMWPTELVGDTSFQQNRSFVWQLFENPEGNKVSQYINFYVLLLIVASAIVTVVETLPGLHRENEETWYNLECFFVINFTIEFLCRVTTTPDYFAFVTSGMNYIDIVSILPFYVDLVAGGAGANLSVLRVLRLGRSLRLIKLSRYSRGIRLVTNAMEQSIDALQLFFFLLVIVMVVCSSAIYYTERGTFNEVSGFWERTNPMTNVKAKSPFQSIPQSFWWCIVTLTTVGYGDTYPITYAGQVVGTVTMLLGLIMLALPLSIIGTNFIEERANMIREMDTDNMNGGEAVESQSLKAQLEDTIDVISEVIKYQELIAESMGDAVKIIAATAAHQKRLQLEKKTDGHALPVLVLESHTQVGSGLGAGVGADNSVGGENSAETGSGVGGTENKAENKIALDAAVVNRLEVLCKNVIKSCKNTEKAIL